MVIPISGLSIAELIMVAAAEEEPMAGDDRCGVLVFGSDYHVRNQRSGACRWEHRAYLGIGGCMLYMQGRTPCVVYILGAQDDEAGSWFVGIQLIKLILVTTDRYIYNQH
jgi:hypothetical protein